MTTKRFTLTIPLTTFRGIKAASKDAHMKPAEVARQSLRLGLPEFSNQFTKQSEAHGAKAHK